MEIIINDVTLRDGLQNEPYYVTTDNKVKLANLIIDSGIKFLEITSFVNPKLIPQLKDSKELMSHPELKEAYFSVLIPNLKGFKRCAFLSKIKEIVLFVSACNKHNIKNLGKEIKESLKNIKEIFDFIKEKKFNYRAAISMVFGSPFINDLPNDKDLFQIIDFFLENGVYDITLSDTWGNANREIFKIQLKKILKQFDFNSFSLHLHDIKGKGILNAEVALDLGLKKFDTSFKGLGGCPFSPEKGGNLNIRDFIGLLKNKKYQININEEKFFEVENFLSKIKFLSHTI